METIAKDELKNAVLEHDEKIVYVRGTRQNYNENQKHDKDKASSKREKHKREDKTSKKQKRDKLKDKEGRATKKKDKQKQKETSKSRRTAKQSLSSKFKSKKLLIQSQFSISTVIKGGMRFKHRRHAILDISEELKENEFIESSNKTVNRQMVFDILDIDDNETSSTPLSGNEEREECASFEHYSNERDDEWLGVKREKALPVNRTGLKENRKIFLGSEQLDIGCEEFMASMKFYWWFLHLGGRMPFQTYIEDYIVKFKLNKCSISFIYFTLTSAFLTVCTTTMAYSVIRIAALFDQGSLSFHERVERLDVDKYWIYTLVTFVSSAVSSSCSLATIFDDGFLVADFLSRWNFAIGVLKYRPVSRIRLYFWLNASYFLLYAGILISLFYTEIVPAVRGTSGFIGLLIVRPFTFEIRFSPYFPYVEKFGLFVHLYTTYSSRAILLMVTLYCRLLVNMARKWNLRLAYVMGMLSTTIATKRVVAVISFQKLFLEHAIIIGFLRHMGRIFSVGLGIFYTLKSFELVILFYRAATLFVHPLPTFNQTHIEGTPTFLPPIAYTDKPLTLYLTMTVLVILSCLEWLITTEQITTCGEAILDGFSFIRRWGLILSKTSQRRRFIQSLNHAFSHASNYYVQAGFTINREFTFSVFFWICVFTSLLIAFSPFKLHTSLITVCSQKGRCVTLSKNRVSWKANTKSQVEIISEIEKENIEDQLEEEREASERERILELERSRIRIPNRNCSREPSSRLLKILQFPQACFADGSIYHPYIQDKDCTDFTSTLPHPYANFVEGGDLRIFNCNRPRNRIPDPRDSCGNIALNNILTGATAPIRAMRVVDVRSGSPYVFCCYDYGFGQEQLNNCNVAFPTAIATTCGVQRFSDQPPFRYAFLELMERQCIDFDVGSRPPECDHIDHCFCDPNGHHALVQFVSRSWNVTCPLNNSV